MIKPDSLRAHLVRFMPDLEHDANRLQMFVSKARPVSRNGKKLSFEYRYTLNLLLLDFALSPDAVTVPLLGWIRRNQPDLLDGSDKGPFAMEVDYLEGRKVDLSIDVQLTEAVGVTPRADGGFDVVHFPEPDFHPEGGDRAWSLYLRDEEDGDLLIGEWTQPDATPFP